MKETIGLATMKMSTARAKSATPPQNRRGTRGIRNCWPGSRGPPRSKGSKGRYRRDTVGGKLRRRSDRGQGAVVGLEIGRGVGGWMVEVPPHRRAQRLEGIRRRPAEQGSSLHAACRDVLAHRARRLQVLGKPILGHA